MSTAYPSAQCLELLDTLLSFNTAADQPNREMVRFIHRYLDQQGVRVRLTPETDDGKRNLFFSIGPDTDNGTVLAAHLDTHESEQSFGLQVENALAYGTGIAETKGFMACVLAAVPAMLEAELERPLHVSLSYDETVGCVGLRDLLFQLKGAGFRASQCVIGKPTGLLPVLESRGVQGYEFLLESAELSHEAMAPLAEQIDTQMTEAVRQFNAIHPTYTLTRTACLATRSSDNTLYRFLTRLSLQYTAEQETEVFDQWISEQQARISAQLLDAVWHQASARLRPCRSYPPSALSAHHPFALWMQEKTQASSFSRLELGSEAGMYQQQLQLPTLLCGPGTLDEQGRECMPLSQLAACEALLRELLHWHTRL